MQVLHDIGFSKGDLLKLTWLYQTRTTPMYPKELYDTYISQFPSVPVGYEYVAKLANRLESSGDLKLAYQDHQKKYYQITDKGFQTLATYKERYHNEISELIVVIERIQYDITRKGKPPVIVENELPPDFRRYLAKLLSVKDITRYMIFKLGLSRSEFYAAEALDVMKLQFGWMPSNGYFYDVVREMEAEGTIKGRWKDDEKRTVRLIQITDDGAVFSKQVKQSLAASIEDILNYLTKIKVLTSH